jgi:hypothetical protein
MGVEDAPVNVSIQILLRTYSTSGVAQLYSHDLPRLGCFPLTDQKVRGEAPQVYMDDLQNRSLTLSKADTFDNHKAPLRIPSKFD